MLSLSHTDSNLFRSYYGEVAIIVYSLCSKQDINLRGRFQWRGYKFFMGMISNIEVSVNVEGSGKCCTPDNFEIFLILKVNFKPYFIQWLHLLLRQKNS